MVSPEVKLVRGRAILICCPPPPRALWLQPPQLLPVLLLVDVLPHLPLDLLLPPWTSVGPLAAAVMLKAIGTLCSPPLTKDLTSPGVGGTACRRTLHVTLIKKYVVVRLFVFRIFPGLKHVSDDEKTHKNPALRGQAASVRTGPKPFCSPSARPAPTATPTRTLPPVLELDGKKWKVVSCGFIYTKKMGMNPAVRGGGVYSDLFMCSAGEPRGGTGPGDQQHGAETSGLCFQV